MILNMVAKPAYYAGHWVTGDSDQLYFPDQAFLNFVIGYILCFVTNFVIEDIFHDSVQSCASRRQDCKAPPTEASSKDCSGTNTYLNSQSGTTEYSDCNHRHQPQNWYNGHQP